MSTVIVSCTARFFMFFPLSFCLIAFIEFLKIKVHDTKNHFYFYLLFCFYVFKFCFVLNGNVAWTITRFFFKLILIIFQSYCNWFLKNWNPRKISLRLIVIFKMEMFSEITFIRHPIKRIVLDEIEKQIYWKMCDVTLRVYRVMYESAFFIIFCIVCLSLQTGKCFFCLY